MAHINVAVIYDKADVINKVYDLIPEYIDFFDEETYSKVQDTGDNFVVSWPGLGRSEITASKEKFYFKSFKDMYDQLLIYAVVTKGHPFECREKECRKLLSEVEPGKTVYVFDCHL